MNVTLYSIHLCILFLSLVTGVINRHRLPSHYKWLFALLAIVFLVESTSMYLMQTTTIRTQPMYHVLLPILYSVLSYIYYRSLQQTPVRRLILYSIPAFVVLHLVLSIFIQPINTINSYALMIADVLIVAWCLYYFYTLVKSMELIHLLSTPLFWISTGNLFFYAGSFFLMGILNYLFKTKRGELAMTLFTLNYLLNYILYSLYIVGFICNRWKKTS